QPHGHDRRLVRALGDLGIQHLHEPARGPPADGNAALLGLHEHVDGGQLLPLGREVGLLPLDGAGHTERLERRHLLPGLRAGFDTRWAHGGKQDRQPKDSKHAARFHDEASESGVTLKGYSGTLSPSRGIAWSRRQARLTRRSSWPTNSGSRCALPNGPSHTTGSNPASVMYWASAGLHRMCRSGSRWSNSSGTSPSTYRRYRSESVIDSTSCPHTSQR